MIFLIPIKNLVFDISGLPGIVCWTWGCGSDPLAFHPVRTDRQNLSRAVSGSYRIRTLPLACVMGCPLLSEVCSNYLTLENEILTSFLPFSIFCQEEYGSKVRRVISHLILLLSKSQHPQLTPKRTYFRGHGAGSSITRGG